jgi:SAM-dependent methyltransferase
VTKGHAAEIYKEYWAGQAAERERRAYYERLYRRVRSRIEIKDSWRVLDVAGGNGQFMRYLGVKQADILDISESGLDEARKSGYRTLVGDIEKRFPVQEESYDAAFCFEVLEHLHCPNKTLAEIHNALKPTGVLYLGQPNMRVDGVYHVRRYYLGDLLDDLDKAGFAPLWIDYVPAYSMPEAILSDIRRNPSWIRKTIQCVNMLLSLLPEQVRYRMAKIVPDRFALLFVVKAVKKSK